MRSERRRSSNGPSSKFLTTCDISISMKASGAQSAPDIVENYRDYVPPAKLMNWVENLLESVPKNYLAGLKTVVLTNHSGLTRNQRRQKVWQRGRKLKLARARGAYYRATRSSPAAVWLYVDNIFRSQPAWTLRVPFLRYICLAPVLYHEIGHHIHAVHRPVYEGKENVADDWSRYFSGKFYRRHYWYARPILYLLWVFLKRVDKQNK
jgi:hypothetical protein